MLVVINVCRKLHWNFQPTVLWTSLKHGTKFQSCIHSITPATLLQNYEQEKVEQHLVAATWGRTQRHRLSMGSVGVITP